MLEQKTALYASSPSHHVKVCCLDKSNRWADKGTGYCVYLEGNGDDPDEMVVRSETDSNLLVSSCVYAEKTYHNYQKLGETKISWTDMETNDLAINFEDAKSRDDIWLRMCDKRGLDGQTCTLNESLDDDSDGADTVLQGKLALPTPAKRNLDKIAKVLENTTSPEINDLANFIVDTCYVNKLFLIFEECERANMINRLHELFIIMKFIILLSSTRVLEHITSDENVIPVASILEYDTATTGMKENHREILKAHSLMELVVPLSDPTIMLTIRQTYRFQYLMDVIMARYLDENLSSKLQELIFRNHIAALDHVKCDANFLGNVFRIIRSHDSDEIKRTQALQAVLQLCAFSNSLQDIPRLELYRKLIAYGLFIAIEIAMSSEDSVRSHILNQQARLNYRAKSNKWNLLQCIINGLTSTIDPGLIHPCDGILKNILELVETRRARDRFEPKVQQDQDIDDILTVFYDKYARSLLHPLMSIENKPMKLDGPITVLEHGQDQGEVFSHLLDILCSTVEQHGHQSKDWVVSGDCFVKVVQLYRSQFEWVKLAALHFFRVCVGLMDDDYNKQLIKHNVFESTVRLLLDTKGSCSAVSFNCLELLEFICHENSKLLVSHLIERFGSELDTVDYTPTCSELRKQYNENQKHLNALASLASPAQSGIISNTRNDSTQTSSLDRSKEGKPHEPNVEDDQWPDGSGDKNDQVSSSASLAPSTVGSLPSKEDKGRRPSLKDTTNDNEELASAVDNDNNTPGYPSPRIPLRLLKKKRDNDNDDDEGEALTAKASKQLAQDKLSVLKRAPRRPLATTTSDEEKDTTAVGNANYIEHSTSKPTSKHLLKTAASDNGGNAFTVDDENRTSEVPSTPISLRPLKHKRDNYGDDDEGEALAAKAFKQLIQDKPSVLKRTPRRPLATTTSDDEEDTTAANNSSYTDPSMSKPTPKRLLKAMPSNNEGVTTAIDNCNNTIGGPSPRMPLRSLKHKRDDNDDGEEDTLTAKKSKQSGQEKPAIWRRTSKRLVRAATSDNEEDTIAVDTDNYTQPNMLKPTYKRLPKAKTSGDNQKASPIDNENSTTENPVPPITSQPLKQKGDDEDDNGGGSLATTASSDQVKTDPVHLK